MLARRFSGDTFKDARHMTLIGKSRCRRNSLQRLIRFDKASGHVLHPCAENCIGDRVPPESPERLACVSRMYAGILREARDIQRLTEALIHRAIEMR